MGNISLEQARSAASQLQQLQQAASMLPQLEANEAKAQSEKRLDEVRKAILQENSKLYADFQQAVSTYRNELESIVSSLKHLAQTLRNVFIIKKRLSDNAQRYVSSVYQHNVTHLKQDTLQASFNAENKVNDCLPGSLMFEPSRKNDPLTGTIAQILSHL